MEIEHCNNIVYGKINLEKEKLNIKYGMNGTGKSTIATALEFKNEDKPLTELKTFGSDEKQEPKVSISERLNSILVFNEYFVNTVVFQESDLIGKKDAFDVFIKTTDYDEKREELDKRLKTLKISIGDDERIIKLRNIIFTYLGKLELHKDKTDLKSNVHYKSIKKKENLYKIPESLKKYSPFITDNDLNINWIDWKTKGETFDQKGICPFCSENLQDDYNIEKESFKEIYQKSDSQNLKNMLDMFESFQEYIDSYRYPDLISCIKSNPDDETIKSLLMSFATDFDYLKNQLDKIQRFDSTVFSDVDLKTLDQNVKELKIEYVRLNLFRNALMEEITNFINSQIDNLENEIIDLRKSMGELRSLMRKTVKNSIEDINKFLNSAGIQYIVNIDVDKNGEAIALLQYRKDDKAITIKDIRKCLSWGERNAFALILFMLYAESKNPDLIILDDPISSFDSNKKYAIIHRMFSKTNGIITKSFFKKTVLMLTHDFEPIIDFVILEKKYIPENISTTFIRNVDGHLDEKVIDKDNDIKPVIQELLGHIRNNNLNMVHRIAFLRKYYEHHGIDENLDAYNILSSLIHGRKTPTTKDETELTEPALTNGKNEIKKYILNFDYNDLITNYFNETKLVDYYFSESNSYLKLQLFRILLSNTKMPELKSKYALVKYIHETYHIENDYAYYLNLVNYDLVPSHVSKSIDKYMDSNYKNPYN